MDMTRVYRGMKRRRGLKRFHKERKGLANDTLYYQVKQLEDNNQVDLEEGGSFDWSYDFVSLCFVLC